MGQFRDVSIKNVVEALNQSFFLPDIQREYVWLKKAKEKKIEQLFDSILRGYPIGTFLFWRLKKNDIETNRDAREDSNKLNFQLYKFIENYDERNTHNQRINVEQILADDLSIVLDGQQRLSSLYIGLVGTRTLRKPKARRNNPNAYEEKQLYINLRYQPSEDNPDDNYEFEFHKKNLLPNNDEKYFWFKVGDVLHLPGVVTYSRENNLSQNEAEILEKLRDAFCIKNLISYFEETEKKLDKVLKIFIRVNSGGTQLSYSDLLMSILTANFSSDIRNLMENFVNSVKSQGFGVMGRDQILKTCLLLTGSNHIFKLKNFSKTNIHKIEEHWELITDNVLKSISILQEFGYRDRLSSAYILSTIAYFLFRNGEVTQIDKDEMLCFVRNAQITSYFTTSLDVKLETVAKTIRESKTFSDVNIKLANNKAQPLLISSADVERMLDYQYGNPATLPVLQLLYPNLDYKNSTFHIDHIFPKSKFNLKNQDLPSNFMRKENFLYNLQLLQGDENLSKRAQDPSLWLSEFYNSDIEQISAYKKRNYIDIDFNLEWITIDSFEEQRSKAILEKLKEVFGF